MEEEMIQALGPATGQALNPEQPVDPVSGNEVPLGSEPENVRDDIPAKLSEGEFVIPANVVKFIGVEKLYKMIEQAEAKMAEMGPENVEDVIEDDGLGPAVNMAEGGEVTGSIAEAVHPYAMKNLGHTYTQPGKPQNYKGPQIIQDNMGFFRVVPYGQAEQAESQGGRKVSQQEASQGRIGPDVDTGRGGDRRYDQDERASGRMDGGYDITTLSDQDLMAKYRQQSELVDFLQTGAGRATAAALGGLIPGVGTMFTLAQPAILAGLRSEMQNRGLGDFGVNGQTYEEFDRDFYGGRNQEGGAFEGQKTVWGGSGPATTYTGDRNAKADSFTTVPDSVLAGATRSVAGQGSADKARSGNTGPNKGAPQRAPAPTSRPDRDSGGKSGGSSGRSGGSSGSSSSRGGGRSGESGDPNSGGWR